MKRLATKLAVVTALALISAMPVLAGEAGKGMGSGDRNQKDECLLVVQTCRTSVDSIHQRIERLNREINKGERVYTKEELRHLQYQLRDATQNLEVLLEGGA